MKKEIVNTILSMSGRYGLDAIFADWVKCMAIAFQNASCMIHNELWQKRENEYLAIMQKYSKEERMKMQEMTTMLGIALGEELSDVLGEIYMESGAGNKLTGQFFTPFHLSKLTAGMSFPEELFDKNGKIKLHEPSVGAGGMVIAVASVLKDRGINYQKCLQVVAQDLDWRSVYMAYVQFSMLGIDAIVVQGDSLINPYEPGKTEKSRIFRTPMNMGLLL